MPPALTDTLTAALAEPPAYRCAVGRWLDTLDPDEVTLLEQSCTPGRINTTYGLLAAAGHDLPCRESTWHRHYTGRCPCPKDTAA